MKYLLFSIFIYGCIVNEGTINIASNNNLPQNDPSGDSLGDDTTDNNSPNVAEEVTPSQNGCPENYVFIEGETHSVNGQNIVVGDFCVMKYEARQGVASDDDLNGDGDFTNDYLAATDHTANPWTNLTASQMQGACRGHGFNETTFKGYDVISNMEWMTIAYQIENIAENWSGGTVGSGSLYRGHTDYAPANMLNITDLSDGYNQTGVHREDQRRTHYVESLDSNGNKNIIWDLSGNVWEIVDWTPGGDFDPGPANCSLNGGAWRSWREIMTDTCPQISPGYYRPRNPQNLPSYTGVNKDLGLVFSVNTSLGYVIRGGSFNDSSSADSIERYGVFAVNFNTNLSAHVYKGFRCVYRF